MRGCREVTRTSESEHWPAVRCLPKSAALSSFPERAGDLFTQRFQQILQRRTLLGLDEHLGRHAGYELQAIEMVHLVFRDDGAHQEIDLVGLLLVLGQVGAD